MSIELIRYQRDKNSGELMQLRLMGNALLENQLDLSKSIHHIGIHPNRDNVISKAMRNTPKVTRPISFLHFDTDETKFCTRAQDSYTSSYKKFPVSSTNFIRFNLCNNELEGNFTLQLRSIVRFLNTKNNSRAKIHCCVSAVYREENVMNLRNI